MERADECMSLWVTDGIGWCFWLVRICFLAISCVFYSAFCYRVLKLDVSPTRLSVDLTLVTNLEDSAKDLELYRWARKFQRALIQSLEDLRLGL